MRKVTEVFWISPQISPEDVRRAAEVGIRAIVNNRPDGERPDQPSGAEIEAAARSAGLDYRAVPVDGRPGLAEATAMRQALDELEGPVLAYCGSGTRSVFAWALAEIGAGRDREAVLLAARNAGYDLSGAI